MKPFFIIIFSLIVQNSFSQTNWKNQKDTLDNGYVLSYSYPNDQFTDWVESSIYIGDKLSDSSEYPIQPDWCISFDDTTMYRLDLDFFKNLEAKSLEKDKGVLVSTFVEKTTMYNGVADRFIYKSTGDNKYLCETILLIVGNKIYLFGNQRPFGDEKEFEKFIRGIRIEKI